MEIERYFTVVNSLGLGGSGDVDHVIDRSSGQHYARKRMSLGPGHHSAARREIFENEVQILKRLSHHHVVCLVASYVDGHTMGILMSPVADMSLASLMEMEPMPSEKKQTLQRCFGCLAAGLAFLHDHHIRHKDIKPRNILVKGSTVLFADFGMSRVNWIESNTSLFTVPDFTRLYVAPETANDEAHTRRSDIWSLGCVFLEMSSALSGKSVRSIRSFFEDFGNGEISYQGNLSATKQWITRLERHRTDDLPWYPAIWVKKMLEPEQAARPSAEKLMQLIRADVASDMTFIQRCCSQAYDELPIHHQNHCSSPRKMATNVSLQGNEFVDQDQLSRVTSHTDADSDAADLMMKPLQHKRGPSLARTPENPKAADAVTPSNAEEGPSIGLETLLEGLPWAKFPKETELPTIDAGFGVNRPLRFVDAESLASVAFELSKFHDKMARVGSSHHASSLIASPKICLVLHLLQRRNFIIHFVKKKVTDKALPMTAQGLKGILNDDKAATDFERTQYCTLVRDVDPEKITHFQDKEYLPFKKICDLGSGGWAKVECAQNVITGHRVALKLFPAASLNRKKEAEFKLSFQKEIASLKRLNGHQHIVQHKDIKSENILIDPSKYPYNLLFTDFGIANDFSQTNQSMTVGPKLEGTLRYCAPEVARRRERATRSDVFSLGCVFLEVTTVLAGKTLSELYDSMDEDAIFHLSLPEISRWISSLASNSKKEIPMALGWCKSMLEERPDDRPSSKQLLEIVAHDAGACSLRKEVFCSFCAAELSVQNTITSKSVQSDVGAVHDDGIPEISKSPNIDWIKMNYTEQMFLEIVHTLYTAMQMLEGSETGSSSNVQELELTYEVTNLLTWGHVVALSLHEDERKPRSMEISENQATILNILVQIKTVLDDLFPLSQTHADFKAMVSESCQIQAKDVCRTRYLPTSTFEYLEKLLQRPHSQVSHQRYENAHFGQVTSELSKRNKDLRRLTAPPTRTELQEKDEEANLELLQLCSSLPELLSLVKAMNPTMLPDDQNLEDLWSMPEPLKTRMSRAEVPGVWNRDPLAIFARFKAINLEVWHHYPRPSDVHLDTSSVELPSYEDEGEYDLRCEASIRTPNGTRVRVLVEWKTYEPRVFDGEPDDKVAERVLELATIAKDNHKPQEFRVLNCLGMFRDIDPWTGEDRTRFGLVFELPRAPSGGVPVDLLRLLEDEPTPSPGERLSLAQAVSSALLYLHAANWLHKGLRGDNILFFRDEVGDIEYGKPFLCGFQYTRPAYNQEMTEKPPENAFDDIYRHPRAQGSRADVSYLKTFDIYSLGVILLEIAYWKPLASILHIDPIKARPRTTNRIRSRLLAQRELLNGLQSILGKSFVEIVRRCLVGPTAFGLSADADERRPQDSARLHAAFYRLVVRELKSPLTTSMF
ncbi:hypothetical protein SLS58_004754 [Diplodia intermedia]|uniref:Protein kinase domain-containing protein n=1 Tax=Diplodia intermedia TaxID=856260 RepID=A0ABR3TT44_9PEZI